MAYNIILLGANLDPHEVAFVTIAGLYACREKNKTSEKGKNRDVTVFFRRQDFPVASEAKWL